MFYHNVIIRETYKYETNKVDGKELVNDWDSLCEVLIWEKYLACMGNISLENGILEEMKELQEKLSKKYLK